MTLFWSPEQMIQEIIEDILCCGSLTDIEVQFIERINTRLDLELTIDNADISLLKELRDKIVMRVRE